MTPLKITHPLVLDGGIPLNFQQKLANELFKQDAPKRKVQVAKESHELIIAAVLIKEVEVLDCRRHKCVMPNTAHSSTKVNHHIQGRQ